MDSFTERVQLLEHIMIAMKYPAPVLVAVALAMCSPTSASRQAGVLEGTVTFIGVPCGPQGDRKTPPCDGPYADYEIVVYNAAGDTVVGRTKSNANARYEITLPGDIEYAVFVPSGIRTQATLSALVPAGGRKTLDLQVDTGIR
jgi:hypothetical protein